MSLMELAVDVDEHTKFDDAFFNFDLRLFPGSFDSLLADFR